MSKKPRGNELISLFKKLRRNGACIPYREKTDEETEASGVTPSA